MPRIRRCRNVEFFPFSTTFIPDNAKDKDVKKVTIKIEELEAIRLKDLLGLSQQACAERMGISRQTFQIIIDSARKKVAEALTEGLGIEIKGGDFTSNACKLKCNSCQSVYEVKYTKDRQVCPICNSQKVKCNNKNYKCGNLCAR